MMANEKMTATIAAGLDGDPCLQRCRQQLASGAAQYLADHPGRLSTRDALATFSIRQRTAAAAGVVIQGIDELLHALQNSTDTRVLLFHVATSDQVFTLFVEEQSESLLGCICVERKFIPPDPSAGR